MGAGEDLHDEPDEGVEPLSDLDDDTGVEPLDPEDDELVLDELEDEWEDDEAHRDDDE